MTHTEIIDAVFDCLEADLKSKLEILRPCTADVFTGTGIARDEPDHIRLWAEYAFASFLREYAANRLTELGNVMEVINYLKATGK